ncbi:MAG: YtxH domain-containing protein [Planctomycetes bacterium]|nr:YtxH domain-containing protein [Planctomycetota bacterium]
MQRTLLRVVIGAFLGSLGGLGLGTCLGLASSFGPCLGFEQGYAFLGILVGAAVGAGIALVERPDPRACNRQDPPDLLREDDARSEKRTSDRAP